MRTFNPTRHRNEQGIGLTEILVGIIIIAMVMVFSVSAFVAASAASSASSNRNQAVQLAQNQIAIAKQAPFNNLAIWVTSTGGQPSINTPDTLNEDGSVKTPGIPSTCSKTWSGTFNGKTEVTTRDYYPGLRYCDSVSINGTDQEYAIYTNIVYVLPENETDEAGTRLIGASYSKKVTVEVVWFEGSTESGDTNWVSFKESYTRAPTLEECIPYQSRDPEAFNSGDFPTGCKYYGITAV